MKKILLGLFILGFAGCASQPKQRLSAAGEQSRAVRAGQPKQIVKPGKKAPAEQVKSIKEEGIVKVKIETTKGVIEAELYEKEAPKTVANFVKLVNQGFYNGIMFHRVIPGFMIQTGDPTGTGMGGPGYKFADEFSPNLKHSYAGVLSMANSGPNTNGSQFFITEAATPWLDGKHSVFGRVTQGLAVVHAIANVPRTSDDRPLERLEMKKVTLV